MNYLNANIKSIVGYLLTTAMLIMSLMLLAGALSGCGTGLANPIQTFYSSSVAGSGHKNAVSQMKFLVKDISIVFDPENPLTDAEINAYLAQKQSRIDQINALMRIYRAFAPANEADLANQYERAAVKAQAELDAIVATRE